MQVLNWFLYINGLQEVYPVGLGEKEESFGKERSPFEMGAEARSLSPRLQSIKEDLCLILALTVIVTAFMGVEVKGEEATRGTESIATLIQVTMRRGRRNQKESRRDDPLAQLMIAVTNMRVDLKKGGGSETTEDTDIIIQGPILILLILQATMRMMESKEVMQSIANAIGGQNQVVQILEVEDDGRARRRSHAIRHKRHRRSESSASDSSTDEDAGAWRRKPDKKYHEHNQWTHSKDSESDDSDGHRDNQRNQSLGKSSYDNHEEAGETTRHRRSRRRRHHHYHKHQHNPVNN